MKNTTFSTNASQRNHFNRFAAVNQNRLPGISGACETKLWS